MRTFRKAQIVLVTLGVWVAGGCASGDDVEPAGTSSARADSTEVAGEARESQSAASENLEAEPTSAAPTSTQPTVKMSDRGNVVKKVGEVGGVVHERGDTLDEAWITFTVDDIEVGGECSSGFADPPANGKYLVVSISAATTSDWPADMEGFPVTFGSGEWSVVGPDGLTLNDVEGNAYTCLRDAEMIPDIGPGEKVAGEVALDVSVESGVLIYKPGWALGTGWEWEF